MAITEAEIQNVKQRFSVIGNSPLLNNAVHVAMQVAPYRYVCFNYRRERKW
jgi:hypothetical protein